MPGSGRGRLVLAGSLILAMLAGLIRLNLPFHSDQAVFAPYAREMAGGASLHRDLWHPMQPGIFYFYRIGGGVFGFNELGIHLFELLYLAAAAMLAVPFLRRSLSQPWLAGLYPLMAVGWFRGCEEAGDAHHRHGSRLGGIGCGLDLRSSLVVVSREPGAVRRRLAGGDRLGRAGRQGWLG